MIPCVALSAEGRYPVPGSLLPGEEDGDRMQVAPFSHKVYNDDKCL